MALGVFSAQSFMELSTAQERKVSEAGETAREVTVAVCPLK